MAHWVFLRFMDDPRIEPAVQRIEAALARIAAVADAVPSAGTAPGPAAGPDAAFREEVGRVLAELDDLIGTLEA